MNEKYYTVIWENRTMAESHTEAAEEIYELLKGSKSLGFIVIDEETNQEYSVVLNEDGEPILVAKHK